MLFFEIITRFVEEENMCSKSISVLREISLSSFMLDLSALMSKIAILNPHI
jgi:hypothetical protein